MNTNKKIKFVIPFLVLILIFSFASACIGGSNPSNAIETVEEEIKEEAAEEEATARNGILIVEKKILKGNKYIIEEGDIQLKVNEGSFFQDDTLIITELENNILKEDEHAIFSDTAYSIDFENSNYFNEPVQLTLKYDDDMIPSGASEFSIFVACDDGIGNIFYIGGEIDEENNTITVDTFHASYWSVGFSKEGIIIFNGDVIKREDLDDYTKKRMDYFKEAVELLATNPNYSTKEGAMEELDKAYTDWYEWVMTADIAVEKLESVNPLHTVEQLIEFAKKEGKGILTEQILLLSADLLAAIPGNTAGVGAAYLTAAGKVVGIVGYIRLAILAGKNIGYSASVGEKIIRMEIAARNYRITDVACEYAGNKWRFLADVKLARELGMDISEDKVNKIISNFELAEGEISSIEQEQNDEESEPEIQKDVGPEEFDFEKLYNDHITAKEAYIIAQDYVWKNTGYERPLLINSMTGRFVLYPDNKLSSNWKLQLLDFAGRFTWLLYHIEIDEKKVINFTKRDVSEEMLEFENDPDMIAPPYYSFNTEDNRWRDSTLAINDFEEYLNNVDVDGHEKINLELFFFPVIESSGYYWDWRVTFWIDDKIDSTSYGITGGNWDKPIQYYINDDIFK